jgi:hypothetical protein
MTPKPERARPRYTTQLQAANSDEVMAVLECMLVNRPVTIEDIRNRAKMMGKAVPPSDRVIQLILHEQRKEGRVLVEKMPCDMTRIYTLLEDVT